VGSQKPDKKCSGKKSGLPDPTGTFIDEGDLQQSTGEAWQRQQKEKKLASIKACCSGFVVALIPCHGCVAAR